MVIETHIYVTITISKC